MIFYDYYARVPDEIVDAFVSGQAMGRLVTVSADGLPHIGLFPFVYAKSGIEMHFNREDEQFADLMARSRCVFEVDDVLGVIPSYWVHPESAVMATAYHRSVVFDCEAAVSTDADMLAAQQARIMSRYQPEGGYKAVQPDDPLYRGAIGHIAAVKLAILGRRVKFKLGQNRPAAVRAKIAEALRARGRPGDERAADALQWTIDQETSETQEEPEMKSPVWPST